MRAVAVVPSVELMVMCTIEVDAVRLAGLAKTSRMDSSSGWSTPAVAVLVPARGEGFRVPARVSHRMYSLISFKGSTPPQNRQLIVYYY